MSVQAVQSAGAGGGLLVNALSPRQAKVADGAASGDATSSNVEQMRSRADETSFSSKAWNPSGETSFSMSTYTQNGTLVQVEAGDRSFTMGNFQNAGLNSATNRFQLAGARDDLNLQVSFTTADGNTKSYKLLESSAFHETETGEIVEGRSKGKVVSDPDDPLKKRAENNIIINLDDGGAFAGSDGDDVLINFGAEARVQGNEGDDTLISMADRVTLVGGAGDDHIKVVDDVIRKPKESTINLESLDYTESNIATGLMDILPAGLVGTDRGTEANILGGDGNDVVDARDAKLENAKVQGNSGDDLMMLDTLAASSVEGGDGNDTIEVQNALRSTIDGGRGDDTLSLDRGKDVTLKGGAGDDNISVDFMVGGHIYGEEGNDTITVSRAVDSYIDAGRGDDTVTVDALVGSTLLGGVGDDTLTVRVVDGGAVHGGLGNDTIALGQAIRSSALGGEGDDTIGVVKNKDSLILGGEGNNTMLTGKEAADLLSGGTLSKFV